MNTAKRVTVTFPDYVYAQLLTQTVPGQVSQFVTDAVRAKLSEEKGRKLRKIDAWNDFLELGKTLPRSSFKQIRAAINKGRA